MVVPKIGAQWAIKKIADEVMAPPPPPPDPAEKAAAAAPAPPAPEYDEFDGELVNDEQGNPIGTAHRMRSVGIYVVSDSHGNLEKELQDCIEDEESRKFFIRDKRGRLTGIIFAAHPDRMPAKAQALRADEI